MTAATLLARAQTWTSPPDDPGRSRASYQVYLPTIDYLAEHGWRAIRIKEVLAKEARLDADAARRLYDVISRRLRTRRHHTPPDM